MAQVGVEPTASLVLSQGGRPVAYRAVCPERELNPQTLGFKPSRSAELAYLGESGPGRTRTADRHLVRVLPSPLGYRTVFLKWSHRELHPDFQRAMLASSCWTMTPKAEAVGLEPTSGKSAAACFPSRFLTNSDDFRYVHQGGSRETRTHKRLFAATCFQGRALIRPDGFRVQAAEAGIEPT